MERRFLERCLAEGKSLEAIGELVGEHPSTVSYWLKSHGLKAHGARRHAPRGDVDANRLRELVAEGLSIRAIAEELGAGYSTVRYWLQRLGLETSQMTRRREANAAKSAGLRRTVLKCARHGRVVFFARPEGGYRCAKCNVAAVAERRRTVKRLLVEEAGGRCRLCGFDEHPAALQFHHLDPSTKEFHLGHQGVTRALRRMRTEAEK
jgi:hypothetical protein